MQEKQSIKIKLKPYTLVVRTTERCNVGCNHCSISATAKGDDLPFDLAIKAMKDAKKNGLDRVHFTGGEPLLYNKLTELIIEAKELNLSHDVTTSTFTKTEEDTLPVLDKLNEAGLECFMLSYDDPHSKRVSLQHFTTFAKEAQKKGIHLCVFVTEGGNTSFKIEDLRKEFINEGIDIDAIDWTISEYQYEGRGEKFISLLEDVPQKSIEDKESFCRCPYVMAVPTLNPNGDILLCHMSRFKTKNFVVGKYPEEPLSSILHKMENAPLYRYLSKYGPQQSLKNLGFLSEDIPNDMCRACEKYLTAMESSDFQNRLDELVEIDNLENIEIDFEGVLPIYQRYLSEKGEKIIT